MALVPSFIQGVADSLCELCQRIEALSTLSVFHPSKCRCLAKSYSVLIPHVLSLTSPLQSSSSPFLQRKLSALLTSLLHTLQEGERFVQDVADLQGRKGWAIFGSDAREQRLLNKALTIPFNTEIFDVHLHDLVCCIATLVWVLADYTSDAGLDVRVEANRVIALLKETWASANEEEDVKIMQAMVHKIVANKRQYTQICNLICGRFSESTSKAKLDLTDAVLPTHLWMDPEAITIMNDFVLGSSPIQVVLPAELMGGRFACKLFYDPFFVKEFAYEAAVLARLRHENVVHLVCCCSKRGPADKMSNLILMELMDQDLGLLLEKRRLEGINPPFSLLAGVDIMLQIAKGMEYVHGLGIMHPNLKSFSILISKSKCASYLDERSNWKVKIGSFGFSWVKHDSSLYTTMKAGPSVWRAPEVLDLENEAKYTKKADVYSFAIVCAEILTGLPGHELLPRKTTIQLIKVLKEGRRPKLPSSCPSAISSFIEKCWHADASERPTFGQICRVLRFFKACILSGETEMLASPLQDDVFGFEASQRTAAERQAEGTFYHPVLDIPSEMHAFRSLWEQNSSKRKDMEHLLLVPDQGFCKDQKPLSYVPPYIEKVAHSLCNLCQRIENLSNQSVLHPSKCRCLARSYTILVWHVLTLASSLSSPSSFFKLKLSALLTALLHTLQEGERFIQDCTYQKRKVQWLRIGSVRKHEQHEWLVNKAHAVALSTEIFDVHLHDLVWCTSILIWLLTDYGDADLHANRVSASLKGIWAFADDEGDIKSMQELFDKISAKEPEHVCNLIRNRLSESPSKLQFNPTSDADVPEYLCMDPKHFKDIRENVLGTSGSVVVFETSWLMGKKFACKNFYRPGDEGVFNHEAKVQAMLRHANLVQLVCCRKKPPSDGRIDCSLVMELMHENLHVLISKRCLNGEYKSFSLLAGVDLMLQIAKGLEYLHNIGIMHRDIKSLNILVSPSLHSLYLEDEGHVNAKIADFGTSKFWQDTSVSLTKKAGTGIWRAPEVLDEEDEEKYTDKADVYSFAIVCSEILTGLPACELLPCDRKSELLKVLKEGRRPELPSSCPPAISRYIEKCWHGDASKRPMFKQICQVFRFFKACILLGETEMLASPLKDDIFEFEEPQRAESERRSESVFDHPVLNIPSEMQVFRSIWEQRRELMEL